MDFCLRIHEREGFTEQGADVCGAATYYGQAAAALGSIGSEAADDCMAAGCDSARGYARVGLGCFGCGEKVESRAVVPDVETAFRKIERRHVSDAPVDALSSRAERTRPSLQGGGQ